MRNTVKKNNNQNVDAIKYTSFVIEMLNDLASQMKEYDLHDEAEMILQAVDDICESAHEKCAYMLIKAVETKGVYLDEQGKEFARILCKLTPEQHGHIASLMKQDL